MLFLEITLAVCIVIVVFIGLSIISWGKKQKKLIKDLKQKNNEQAEQFANELQGARCREREAFSQCYQMRKALEAKTKELEIAEKKIKVYAESMAKGTETMQQAKEQISTFQGQGRQLEDKFKQLRKQIENPSKSYLIKHLFKTYKIKSQADLAKALGVSRAAISKIIS